MVSHAEVGLFYRDFLIKLEPSLEGRLRVKYDPKIEQNWHVRKGQGIIGVTLSVSPLHDDFPEITRRCANAALEIRFGTTTAEAISSGETC